MLSMKYSTSSQIRAVPSTWADPGGVSIVYLMSAFPSPERERAASISKQARELFPRACLVSVFCPGVTARSEPGGNAENVDHSASSLAQAIQFCISWQEGRSKTLASSLHREGSGAPLGRRGASALAQAVLTT
jgi:hypothetical protein